MSIDEAGQHCQFVLGIQNMVLWNSVKYETITEGVSLVISVYLTNQTFSLQPVVWSSLRPNNQSMIWQLQTVSSSFKVKVIARFSVLSCSH